MYAVPDQLPRITAFAVLGIYIAFQAVVLAALRQRLKGWRPAGNWNLGRYGFAVNVLALCYGIFAMVLLLKPGDTGSFCNDQPQRTPAGVPVGPAAGAGRSAVLLYPVP